MIAQKRGSPTRRDFTRKMISLVLSAVMTLGQFGTVAFAAEDADTGPPVSIRYEDSGPEDEATVGSSFQTGQRTRLYVWIRRREAWISVSLPFARST